MAGQPAEAALTEIWQIHLYSGTGVPPAGIVLIMLSLPRRVVIPLIVAFGLFMENLDSTVIVTALPAIADSLGVDPLALNLAITSYLLSLAVFIPLSGWAADRFGARNVFTLAIGVFVAGSIACGFADNLGTLVGARILQGAGGAMMVPVGRLVVLKTIPKSELVSSMAYLTVPALIGPVLGPPVGGFIATYFSWRWIFFINVPIGLIGGIVAWRLIGDIREENPRPLDARGFVLVGLGLAGLMFGFETVGREMLSDSVVAILIAGGAAAAGLYVLHARRTPTRILELALLQVATFRVSVVGGGLFRIGVGAIPFLLPLMLQVGFGLSPFASGLLTFASAAGALTMKMSAAPILRRFGFRRVLMWNAAISAGLIGTYGLFSPETAHALILVLLLAGGFFRSLQFTAINTIAYAEIAAGQMSQATTLAAVAQQLSLSFGVAIGAMLLHLTLALHGTGGALDAASFAPAFFGIGALALLSFLSFRTLQPGAGKELAGR